MTYEALQGFVKSNRWSELEQAWLSAIDETEVDHKQLLSIIDLTVKAGQSHEADTMGWAWLEAIKESRGAHQALELGRELLVKLTDGDELREEILTLYRQTHTDRPDLEEWIERSGLKSGKSVRRALRFLDVGLGLAVGACLLHRTEDHAAEVKALNAATGEVTLRLARGTRHADLESVINDYDLAAPDDFRVLQQLHPERIIELAAKDPAALVIGILRGHGTGEAGGGASGPDHRLGNRMSRDNLKLVLVPRYVAADAWSDWWGRLREAVKKSRNLRIEGRSPMFVIYDPAGQTAEEEAWAAFEKAGAPRDWLEILEGYLRLTKEQKTAADAPFLNRVQKALVKHIERFARHKEPAQAFATALVIERVAMDGLPVSADAHGLALDMLKKAADPVRVVKDVPDARLWSLALACLEQGFPEKWPEYFAELILHATAAQCDGLAKKVEKAGRGDLLQMTVDRALNEPGRFTDAVMWIWKGPDVERTLSVPPLVELLGTILTLVGPARISQGKAMGQSVNEMRAKVRSGLSAKDYARYRECVLGLEDESLAQALRRQIERAEGLGPTVQDEMSNILRARFPKLYVKPKVAIWEDESVLYFTAAGLKAKQDELHEIVNVKMRENAKAIGEAASHGDLSENSEYKFALEERDLLRARVAKLNREISLAKVLEAGDVPMDHVSIGHRVMLRPTGGGEPLVMTILGYDESDISNRVYSYHSPLARQLLGRKPGQVLSLQLGDHTVEYAIERIESAV